MRARGSRMPIPGFNSLGLLPAGTWDCTLGEIESRLCWNQHRRAVWKDCRSFIDSHLKPIGLVDPILIDGSFVRDKAHPQDVDLVADCTNGTATVFGKVMLLRFKHDEIKETYSVDFWARHPVIPHDLAHFFQYAGDKCAMELSIDPKHPKGILRVSL